MAPPSDEGPAGKPAARAAARARRDALDPRERALRSSAIASRVDLDILAGVPVGAVVALYASKGSEVETAELDARARARGLVVAYPRVVPGSPRLTFHAVERARLGPGSFGLREPAADCPAVAAGDLHTVLVPGLAFDLAGRRLGWGRGYYDATLATAPRARRVALAFACQLVDRVPTGPHDAPLHALVTEAAVHRFAS